MVVKPATEILPEPAGARSMTNAAPASPTVGDASSLLMTLCTCRAAFALTGKMYSPTRVPEAVLRSSSSESQRIMFSC